MPRKRQTRREEERNDEVVVRAFSCRYSDGHVLETHDHAWSQLLVARDGVMEIETGGHSWVVPPNRALWVPRGVPHRVRMMGPVAMRALYVSPFFQMRALPAMTATSVVHVTPLFRELVLHVAAKGALDRTNPRDARLAELFADLIEVAPHAPTDLIWPRDPRAARVAEHLAGDLSEDHAIADLARRAGASVRTLERLFLDETGLTLGRFRRELRLRHAVHLLANGMPVTRIAIDVGYDSTSAFITTFRRAFGCTPGAFFAS